MGRTVANQGHLKPERKHGLHGEEREREGFLVKKLGIEGLMKSTTKEELVPVVHAGDERCHVLQAANNEAVFSPRFTSAELRFDDRS